MYRILEKKVKAKDVIEYVIEAPEVAKNASPGQFVILRVNAEGERVPFTICDFDKNKGTVSILVQTVGYTTAVLAQKQAGETIQDFVGPLGTPTDLTQNEKILLIGGGIGAAVIYPQVVALSKTPADVSVIIGARNKELVMYVEEIKRLVQDVYVMTDDGSEGEKGFVTEKAKELLDKFNLNNKVNFDIKGYDVVMAVGPIPMMQAVSDLTRQYEVHTIVSMNSIMLDGTGMCGCCRLTVGGETKYACVDGPEFDGHLVDFAEARERGAYYRDFEKEEYCRLTGDSRQS